jgi:hypothetical protein
MTDELELAVAMIRDTYLETLHQHLEECSGVENLMRVAEDVMNRIALAVKRARMIANEARGLAVVSARLEGAPGSYVLDGVPDLTELERAQLFLDNEETRARLYLQR